MTGPVMMTKVFRNASNSEVKILSNEYLEPEYSKIDKDKTILLHRHEQSWAGSCSCVTKCCLAHPNCLYWTLVTFAIFALLLIIAGMVREVMFYL